MKVDKQTESRLISISDSIRHVAESDSQHIPDKIGCLMTNIYLIELEINRLKHIKQ